MTSSKKLYLAYLLEKKLNKIEIVGTLQKPTPIYNLSPLEDKMLKKHLTEAIEKNLIRDFKPPFGAAVFFVQKKDGPLCLVSNIGP